MRRITGGGGEQRDQDRGREQAAPPRGGHARIAAAARPGRAAAPLGPSTPGRSLALLTPGCGRRGGAGRGRPWRGAGGGAGRAGGAGVRRFGGRGRVVLPRVLPALLPKYSGGAELEDLAIFWEVPGEVRGEVQRPATAWRGHVTRRPNPAAPAAGLASPVLDGGEVLLRAGVRCTGGPGGCLIGLRPRRVIIR